MSSTLSDAFQEVPVHIRYNDLESIPEAHDSFIWQDIDVNDYPSVDEATVGGVPVVDLNDPNAMKLLLVSHECEMWGVFQVVNHGVPMSSLQNIEAQVRRLFCLPSEHKLKVARLSVSIFGYGRVPMSSFFPKLMSEGFTIVDSPVEHTRQLWPYDYTQF
ncbi:hypothetical protein Scep_016411 [Stephania cephalantha]|uniref:Non-haem dioxygenase N-terminal domain-containing protein n=1 Tax=Stephania cephalantha TaxID=152367 RepID=A0AAP0IML1_9MAGN